MERDQLQPVLWATSLVLLAFLFAGDTRFTGLAGIAWILGVAASTFMRLPTSSGNQLSLVFAVVSAAPLLLTDSQGLPNGADLGVVVALGYLGGWVAHQLRGIESGVTSRFIRGSVGAAAFVILYASLASVFVSDGGRLGSFVVGAVAWFGIETGMWALSQYDSNSISRRYLSRLAAQDWSVAFSLFIAGALFGFTWPDLGVWTLAIVLVPFAFAYLAFHRAHTARVTYGQTIKALARIPEVAGLSPDGHSDRTAAVATAVAQELGMTPDQVTEVEYAARLHDIGRITLNEPNIIKMGFTEEDIARWGSEIIGEAPYLRPVADLVKQQHHPYRRPGEQRDPHLPVASKIIKAASALDHATHELGFSRLEALEVLHRGAAYDFDPDVVAAVRDVVGD